MAEEASVGEEAGGGKMTMVVGVDDSETSYYALQRVLKHLKSSLRVINKAKELCAQHVSDAEFEVVEGDARNVLCEAVERHHAEMLVVGNHGYGAIKRAVLGSVSDYCAYHAHTAP